MRIGYLANHPEFILPLAQRRLEHYRELLPEYKLETHVTKLQQHLNRDRLPIAWVAYSHDQVLGMAALREHDLDGREDLTPWLGGVYVLSQFRRQGIGSALCTTVERKAAELGVGTLYLFTLDQQRLYSHLGWLNLEPCTWRGQSADIMMKSLGTA